MARDTRSFKYQKRSKEDVRTRANMRGGNFDSFIKPEYKMYKVRDGKNLIRIMPPTWDDAKHYGFDIYVNYGIGADNQSYLSLSKMKGEADPIADARKQAEREGDKDLAKALRANQRILMWIIDRQDEDEGPQLWAAPFTVDKDIANVSFDEDTKEVVFIDDPENGCDVRFHKEGEGMLTKYPGAKIKLLKPSPLCEDEKLQDEWLEYVQENPIPDCLNYYDAEYIASVFDGQVRGKDEEIDEKPRRRKPTEDEEDPDEKPRRRVAKPAEDEEDENPTGRRGRRALVDSDDHEDDNQEEKPSRRSRLKPEPEEESEEEPEEKPKPSLRDRLRARRQPAEDED